jgi:hypothetical protein
VKCLPPSNNYNHNDDGDGGVVVVDDDDDDDDITTLYKHVTVVDMIHYNNNKLFNSYQWAHNALLLNTRGYYLFIYSFFPYPYQLDIEMSKQI